MSDSQRIGPAPDPCSGCGSKRGPSLYEDGSIKCHKCGHKVEGDSDQGYKPSTSNLTFLEVTYVALPARAITAATCRKWGYGVATTPSGIKVHVAQHFDASRRLVAQKTRDSEKNFSWIGRPKNLGFYGSWL